jgi:hypothetical protein
MRMPSQRRKQTEGGQEILEFGLVAILFVPMFLGTFVVGMNLIRSNAVSEVIRDLDDMYIHGADFSTLPLQQEAQRLSQGLNLQISGFSGDSAGHEQSNVSNSGNGLITLTQIMWIGATTDPNCAAAGAGNCTNANSFVYTQQLQFGNSSLANSGTVSAGNASAAGATINSSGLVFNFVTDAHARLGSAAQSAMSSLWQTTSNGQTALVDGQIVYIAEGYFQSPDLTVGSLSGGGVYGRYFF